MVAKGIKSWDILKGISAGLCLLDKDLRIVWVNKYQADWFGLPEKICGKHCYRIFERRSHICRGCPTVKVFKSGQTHTARRIGITTDGKKHYYYLTVSPIKDNHGSVVCALELVQEITENVLKERQNKKIIQRLRQMCGKLSAVNKRLFANTEKLKHLTQNLLKFKNLFKEKYRRKVDELFWMKKELRDIFRVNQSLSAAINLKKISGLIARFSCDLMHTDACILRLLDERGRFLSINASYCVSENYLKNLPLLRIGEGISGKVAKSKKPAVVYDINGNGRLKHQELMKREGIKSVLSVPVVFQDKLLGVISTYSKKLRHFNEDEIEVMRTFANQAAIAIQESRYYEDIHLNYYNTIHALVLALESRDPYTRGHTERVTRYSLETGRALQLPKEELEVLRYASEVHDVGKISIPDFILSKPGRLTPAERAVIEIHPVKSAEILEPLDFLRPTLSIVRHHHERYDGTGYPDGLTKEKIPLLARILACADAFDAMTSERPYRRRRLLTEEALAEIKNNAGAQFDPHIAYVFVKVITHNSCHKVLA